ncbi:hypothetical protein AB0M72_13190 [Nocardiopsis dassonvillei]
MSTFKSENGIRSDVMTGWSGVFSSAVAGADERRKAGTRASTAADADRLRDRGLLLKIPLSSGELISGFQENHSGGIAWEQVGVLIRVSGQCPSGLLFFSVVAGGGRSIFCSFFVALQVRAALISDDLNGGMWKFSAWLGP